MNITNKRIEGKSFIVFSGRDFEELEYLKKRLRGVVPVLWEGERQTYTVSVPVIEGRLLLQETLDEWEDQVSLFRKTFIAGMIDEVPASKRTT